MHTVLSAVVSSFSVSSLRFVLGVSVGMYLGDALSRQKVFSGTHMV